MIGSGHAQTGADLRLSGDIADTPGCWLLNGDKRMRLDRGVIVAARHLHISPQEAQAYGVRKMGTRYPFRPRASEGPCLKM